MTEHLHDPRFDLCIYTGADFTHPGYRGMGLNTQLTDYGFMSLKTKIVTFYQENNPHIISLVYGVTCSNESRIKSISDAFKRFLKKLSNDTVDQPLIINKYVATKPSFDLQATECIPLPDENAVPGFDVGLSYPLEMPP